MRHRFLEFGGHDQAVGGTLPPETFAAFREDVRALFAEKISREELEPRDDAFAELPLDGISDELLGHLERFEPHGAGNTRPVFSCREARAAGAFRPLGESGWRGRFETGGGPVDAVCWSEKPAVGEWTVEGDWMRLHYRVSRSRWSGRPEIEIVGAWPAESRTGETAVSIETADYAGAT
jgi:hypothetical protein